LAGRRIGVGLVVLVALVVGFATVQYVRLSTGITKSHIFSGSGAAGLAGRSPHGDVNLLVIGLDSRLDENGRPLPADTYAALHAGDASSGGENANVLIVLHVPGDGSKATALSIPRDDYVALPGCPDGQCMGKIKQAYGLAFDQAARHLNRSGAPGGATRVQRQRDAGRTAQIAAVGQFLGGVHIDHFVEVTLVAFYELAKVVQPVTVCVNSNTQDRYSGADFHQGRQQINAAQALAFVRQRRDDTHPELNFTDLDRERRQQAFIASLAFQLRQAGTLANPRKVAGIVTVAKANFAIDDGLSVPSLAGLANRLSGGNLTFYTLPVQRFGRTARGEDVNIVDLPVIRSTAGQLLNPPPAHRTSPAPAPPTAAVAPPRGAVQVLNATSRAGLARRTQQTLTARGFHLTGVASTTAQASSSITYGPGGQPTAAALSTTLGVPDSPDPGVPAGSIRLVLGADFVLPPSTTSPAAPGAPASAVPATGTGRNAPPPTALTALPGGGIPCVK